MNMRNLALITGLALITSGCAIGPRHYERPYYGDQSDSYDAGYDDGYYDYHDTPSYDGYYDVRVIFIGSIPYYVDDDRYIRPIPPQYREHFYRQRYMERNRRLPPPMFSRDREVRDGYPMSRIVYMNGVPYYVDNDRGARPLPNRLHDRFRYTPMPQNNGRPEGGRPLPSLQREDERRDNAPAFMREREQNAPPAYGREREQNAPPAYGREREQNALPAYGREREQNQPPAFGREREQNQPPAFGRERDNSNQPAFMRQREQTPALIQQRNENRTQEREQIRIPGSRGQEQGKGGMSYPQQRNDNSSRVPQQNNGASQRNNASKRAPGHKGEGQDNNDAQDDRDKKRRNGRE